MDRKCISTAAIGRASGSNFQKFQATINITTAFHASMLNRQSACENINISGEFENLSKVLRTLSGQGVISAICSSWVHNDEYTCTPEINTYYVIKLLCNKQMASDKLKVVIENELLEDDSNSSRSDNENSSSSREGDVSSETASSKSVIEKDVIVAPPESVTIHRPFSVPVSSLRYTILNLTQANVYPSYISHT
jgi:hypothetical protein